MPEANRPDSNDILIGFQAQPFIVHDYFKTGFRNLHGHPLILRYASTTDAPPLKAARAVHLTSLLNDWSACSLAIAFICLVCSSVNADPPLRLACSSCSTRP